MLMQVDISISSTDLNKAMVPKSLMYWRATIVVEHTELSVGWLAEFLALTGQTIAILVKLVSTASWLLAQQSE